MNKHPLCFCGSNQPFLNCCEPYISEQKLPDTPEQLMRSRYSAFNLGDVNYLLETLSPEQHQNDDRQIIQQTINETKWLGLKIIESFELDEQTGIVEFIAFFADKGNFGQLHEKSRFNKINGKWFYLDGQQLPPIKIGRNENCFCYSGKKFKKCHGK